MKYTCLEEGCDWFKETYSMYADRETFAEIFEHEKMHKEKKNVS